MFVLVATRECASPAEGKADRRHRADRSKRVSAVTHAMCICARKALASRTTKKWNICALVLHVVELNMPNHVLYFQFVSLVVKT